MIAYLDSSAVTRLYLRDEPEHERIRGLIDNPDVAAVTGTWTRIEVAGALVRAARRGRRTEQQLHAALRVLAADLGADGPITVLAADQHAVEARALELVVEHGLRAMDAWHLAVADLHVRELAERSEPTAFISRDAEQAAVAELLGFEPG